ncbi:enoyl-CoA hydratase/isomerase family protein [Sporosarcina cyprini]|uniref:enoyl-CoA hydratase/isomerase family protein n=1 Tax=Sporosarcina cyprini TaxID=2910523 RepID=UPI001EE02FC2|nr:enoyl-CoA hydratase-related protein [Sporosarcina cyprini]MCG3088257.1 enoyl-CoA hydratase-related protein [Sporosarcina cyprini]
MPPGDTPRLVHLIGAAKIKELIMLAEPIGADEALRIGLVNRVVSGTRLFDEVQQFIEALNKSPAAALPMTKKLINSMIPVGGNTLALERKESDRTFPL